MLGIPRKMLPNARRPKQPSNTDCMDKICKNNVKLYLGGYFGTVDGLINSACVFVLGGLTCEISQL